MSQGYAMWPQPDHAARDEGPRPGTRCGYHGACRVIDSAEHTPMTRATLARGAWQRYSHGGQDAHVSPSGFGSTIVIVASAHSRKASDTPCFR